jgi:hypothetical protein
MLHATDLEGQCIKVGDHLEGYIVTVATSIRLMVSGGEQDAPCSVCLS